MYTVKHQTPSGDEEIIAAAHVAYRTQGRPALVVTAPSGEQRSLDAAGTYYVMNELGRNVAVYRLKVVLGRAHP
jgi:hypothetical protein